MHVKHVCTSTNLAMQPELVLKQHVLCSLHGTKLCLHSWQNWLHIEQKIAYIADVPSCLHGSNLPDSPDSTTLSASHQSSFWCGLTAAACASALGHLASSGGCNEHAAISTSHSPAAGFASHAEALTEPQLEAEPETAISHASDADPDQSDLSHATYMLPLQLLRHLHSLQQSVSSGTWQMLWSIYAQQHVPHGQLHLLI